MGPGIIALLRGFDHPLLSYLNMYILIFSLLGYGKVLQRETGSVDRIKESEPVWYRNRIEAGVSFMFLLR